MWCILPCTSHIQPFSHWIIKEASVITHPKKLSFLLYLLAKLAHLMVNYFLVYNTLKTSRKICFSLAFNFSLSVILYQEEGHLILDLTQENMVKDRHTNHVKIISWRRQKPWWWRMHPTITLRVQMPDQKAASAWDFQQITET